MQKKEKNRNFWIIFHFQLIFSWFWLKNVKVSISQEFSRNFFWFLQILDRNCPQFPKIIVPSLDQDIFNFALKTWGAMSQLFLLLLGRRQISAVSKCLQVLANRKRNFPQQWQNFSCLVWRGGSSQDNQYANGR